MSLNTSTPIEKLEDLKSPFNHFAQIRAIFDIVRLCKTETVFLQRLNNFKERCPREITYLSKSYAM